MHEFAIGWCGSAHDLDRHLALAQECPEIELVACCCPGGAPRPGLPPCVASVDELLQRDILGLVICTSPAEKAHWCGRALAQGKKVLCAPPLSDRLGLLRRAVPEDDAESGLVVASPAYYSDVGRAVLAPADGIGRLVFFELLVGRRRERLADRREGVLLLEGQDYLAVLSEGWGPVDSVWCQSRSLLRNRPTEDICVVYVKFADGKEGLVRLHALGTSEQAQLALFGVQGTLCVTSPLDDRADVVVWRQAYADFALLLTGEAQPAWSGKQASQGLRLMHWVEQSARLSREVFAREVAREP